MGSPRPLLRCPCRQRRRARSARLPSNTGGSRGCRRGPRPSDVFPGKVLPHLAPGFVNVLGRNQHPSASKKTLCASKWLFQGHLVPRARGVAQDLLLLVQAERSHRVENGPFNLTCGPLPYDYQSAGNVRWVVPGWPELLLGPSGRRRISSQRRQHPPFLGARQPPLQQMGLPRRLANLALQFRDLAFRPAFTVGSRKPSLALVAPTPQTNQSPDASCRIPMQE